MNLSDSCLYTEEELLDILHDREEDIINVIRMNYDTLISVGHIGNNHYRVYYNKDGVEKYFQIDKCNLVGVEGIK